jgi:hypothetical protein
MISAMPCRSGRPPFVVFAFAGLLLPVLYSLSLGCLAWLDARDLLPYWQWLDDAMEHYFQPVHILYDHAPAPVANLIDWYFNLWV